MRTNIYNINMNRIQGTTCYQTTIESIEWTGISVLFSDNKDSGPGYMK